MERIVLYLKSKKEYDGFSLERGKSSGKARKNEEGSLNKRIPRCKFFSAQDTANLAGTESCAANRKYFVTYPFFLYL